MPKTYIISVSAGSGCYRHIALPLDATLLDLHRAILAAFSYEEVGDHYFQGKDFLAVAPTRQIVGSPTTDAVALSSLPSGWKLRHACGSPIDFSCKLLRESEEALPQVVKSVGKSPAQAPAEEPETDERGLPTQYHPLNLKKMVAALPMDGEAFTQIQRYFQAAVNFYHRIPLQDLWLIYTRQNPSISLEDFLAAAAVIRHMNMPGYVVGQEALYLDAPTSAPEDWELIADYLTDVDDYEAICALQKSCSYYIPSKEELLAYEDPHYLPDLPALRALRRFLSAKIADKTEVEDQLLNACIAFAMDPEPDIRVSLPEPPSQQDRDTLDGLCCDLSAQLRRPIYRGHTQEEVAESPDLWESTPQPSPQLSQAASMLQWTASAPMAPALRQNLMEALLSHQVPHKKVGRNDPCPCGSGKKYKKCCGR